MKAERGRVRDQSRDSGGSASETDSEEDVEDQVWLRSGQSATYPQSFRLPGEKESDIYAEKLLAGGGSDNDLPAADRL